MRDENRAPPNEERIPIVILGGSDGRPSELPEEAVEAHSLSGTKGADIVIEGQPLICNVVQRIERSGAFGPIFLAGPARVYRALVPDLELIDTDADFGTNIARALRVLDARHPGRPVAFITCDILPEAETLRSMAADYRSREGCDLWFAVVRVPEDQSALGASAWKPTYRVVPKVGESAVTTLGGHLSIVRPQALRLDFLGRLFRHVYATRNKSLAHRRRVVFVKMLASLLREDLVRLLRGRLPVVTWHTVRAASIAVRKLARGSITLGQLEHVLADLLIRRERIKTVGRRVRVALVDDLGLALDIDTEEEALAWGSS